MGAKLERTGIGVGYAVEAGRSKDALQADESADGCDSD
jgi:hypothetical protein